ncbi:MAG: prenyltransferase/squalene oxidase repeat-containing protein [Solirubrobacteraceae bacterium]
MSWPLASFLLVGLVLGLGWLAYERRHPSARMAAVVATLAAVAALGRDAFVALPDVKPITAMTLVVGYALGPLPGFTVGALGMLASNVMLGQGPYTPWQMAAWGGVGLAGAALGRLSGRRVGRVGLAVACALAALAAKEVMNLYTWTLGASHTPAAFLAVAASALPFDVTDVVATLLFALAFGPELARLLGRARARMDVSWEPFGALGPPGAPPAPGSGGAAGASANAARSMGAAGLLAAAVLAGTLLLGGPRAGASAPQARPNVSRELSYLIGAQNADGGFGAARGQSSSELYSAWTAIGLAAAGRDPQSVRRGGHSVLDAVRGEASSLQGAGDMERTILALHACGASVHSLAGGDPVRRLLAFREPDGSFGHLSNLTAFAIFALRAAGYGPGAADVRAAGRWLAAQQDPDGGFGFGARGGGSDVDDTAAALQGLVDAGVSSGRVRSRAVEFLIRAQNLDGGYPQQPGGESNAQSTAWAIQGLVAAGRDVGALTRAGSRSPLGYLQSLVAPDGSVRYSRTGTQTPVWVTAQALTALAERPFPISPPRRARASAVGSSAASAAVGRTRARSAARSVRAGAGARAPGAARGPVPQARGVGLEELAHALGALVGALIGPMLR